MVELRILGPLKLSASDGRDVGAVARQSRRVALLAYLAAAVPRGLHRRDRLLTLFWPESDQTRARAALNQAIYVLRTALGDQAVITQGNDEVGVDPQQVWCDVAAFEAAIDAGDLVTALGSYRGDLLEGFFVAEAPEFEHWLDHERDRLRQRASEGAWGLAEATASVDAIGAARWARRAAEFLPADEAVIRRLMQFLRKLGDRAAAVRAYESYAWQLAREYELEPSTETQLLATAIRREVQRVPWTLAPGSVLSENAADVPRRKRRLWAGVSIGVVAIAVSLAAWVTRPRPEVPPSPVVRVTLEVSSRALGAPIGGSTVALSPDGSRLAYVIPAEDGTQLVVRPMDRSQSTPVPHTEGASLPFFSPDGAWLGFVADGKLRKVSLDGAEGGGGSPAITVTSVASNVPGASWGSNGAIVFASGKSGSALWRVPATGDAAQLLARPDSSSGAVYRWPEILPSGDAAVFTIIDTRGFRLATVSFASGAVRDLGLEGTNPHFVSPHYLIFARLDGALLGVAFDPKRLELQGQVFPVTDGIMVGLAGAAKLGVSRSGMVAYVPEAAQDRSLFIVDQHGRTTRVPVSSRAFYSGHFSPDGRRIAVAAEAAGGGTDLWMIDLKRASLSRVTSDSGSVSPIWSPDGSRLAFGDKPGGRAVGFEIRWRRVSGNDSSETLLPGDVGQFPADFTPDGRAIVFQKRAESSRGDIWVLPLTGERTPRAYLQTRFDERGPAVSPDGHWLAYVSDESGSDEVYVDAFPEPSAAVRVSDDGGGEPRWAPDGRELFYRGSRGMMAVAVDFTPNFRAVSSRILFNDDQYVNADNRLAAYDVHPDGQRFLMTQRGAASDQVVVLMNWLGRRP